MRRERGREEDRSGHGGKLCDGPLVRIIATTSTKRR